MSVSLMSATFKATLPDVEVDGRNVAQSTLKVVLLALADHANDDGKSIYPAVARLAKMTGLTERSVQRAEHALQKIGILVQVGMSEYGTKEFKIVPSRLHQFQGGVNLVHQGGESSTQNHAPDSPKPSIKPSIKPNINSEPIAQKLSDHKCRFNPNSGVIIQGWKDDFPDEIILRAIDDAASRGKCSIPYIEQILITWKAQGVPPTREEKIKNARSNHQPNRAAVPAQNDYTPDELAAEIAAARAWKQQQGQYVNV
jgi:DnaD/phage-associated family protein